MSKPWMWSSKNSWNINVNRKTWEHFRYMYWASLKPQDLSESRASFKPFSWSSGITVGLAHLEASHEWGVSGEHLFGHMDRSSVWPVVLTARFDPFQAELIQVYGWDRGGQQRLFTFALGWEPQLADTCELQHLIERQFKHQWCESGGILTNCSSWKVVDSSCHGEDRCLCPFLAEELRGEVPQGDWKIGWSWWRFSGCGCSLI